LWFVLQKEKHLLKTSQHEAKRSQGEFAKKSRLIKVISFIFFFLLIYFIWMRIKLKIITNNKNKNNNQENW